LYKLTTGEIFKYEHIATGEEVIVYNEVLDEMKILLSVTGVLWYDSSMCFISRSLLSETVLDGNWKVIGVL